MRWLIRMMVFFALLWCGWWALASYGAKRGFENAIAAQSADGWQAQVSQDGFPFRLRTRFGNLTLTDPDSQMTLTLDDATLSTPTHWPGDITLDLPQTPITLHTPVSDILLSFQDAQANFHLLPSLDLTFAQTSIQSGPWQASLGAIEFMRANDLTLTFTKDDPQPQTYVLALNATQLTPGILLRDLLALPPEWPAMFDSFNANSALTFDQTLDRNMANVALERIEIKSLSVFWGPIHITASGAINVQPDGVPQGAIDLQITKWRNLLDLAEHAGALPPGSRQGPEIMLQALANMEGDPEDLDLALSFRNGRMALGPIDLGPAPSLR